MDLAFTPELELEWAVGPDTKVVFEPDDSPEFFEGTLADGLDDE
jgi:hypothetical protein